MGDGRLDIDKLLTDFPIFFREHSEHWVERFDYKEVGPQLLLQAYLQRIVNGGGRIEREYGLGHRRTDLLIIWYHGAEVMVQKVVIELKIQRGSLKKTIQEGLEQTWHSMDRADSEDGHLVIFNRSADMPWAEKIFTRTEWINGKPIHIWAM